MLNKRYGSYFLANEKDVENDGSINIKAKPINRKRYDFVNDTDPDNFVDNLNDEDLSDEELAPEGFPMGDISDEPDNDPSDTELDQFPDDSLDDETSELDIPEFPNEDSDDLDSIEDFPTDNDIDEFPTDGSDENDDNIEDFPSDEGNDNEGSIPDNLDHSSSDILSDGETLINQIIKDKLGDKLPTPDEIINDLRKKVYDGNPANIQNATQTNINNNDIPDFPTDSGQNVDTSIDTQNSNIPQFPEAEPNPMAATQDQVIVQFPADNTMQQPQQQIPADNNIPGTEPFPGDTTMAGTPNTDTNIVAAPDTGGMDGFPADTDFTNNAGTGLPGTDMNAMGMPGQMGAPTQQPGPGVGYDSMRKYNLYQEYHKLLNAIDNYISKLENLIFDEPHQNLIVKTVTDKLNEVKKLCYDYITMKFEVASYAQSYVFFEELAVSIQVIFTILMTISSYNTYQNDKKKKDNKTSKKDTKNKK